jgi:hypothetical protein
MIMAGIAYNLKKPINYSGREFCDTIINLLAPQVPLILININVAKNPLKQKLFFV